MKLWSNDADLTQFVIPWISRLLTAASSLQVLEYDVHDIPCPPVLSRLPLKHLILKVTPEIDLTGALEDLACCQLLESLSIDTNRGTHHSQNDTYPQLPRMDLRTAAKLQHVQLTGFTSGTSQELVLPPGCALCLQGYYRPIQGWSKEGVAGREAVTALSVWPHQPCRLADIDVVQFWPRGLDEFPNLQFLELGGLQGNRELDLGIFASVPRIKICTRGDLTVSVPRGSWELLELEGYGWKVSFADLHSFLRSVPVFAFTLPSAEAEFAEQLAEACFCVGAGLYKQEHAMRVGGIFARFSSSTPTYQQMTKISTDRRYVQSIHSDSFELWGVWPADPVRSAITGLTPLERSAHV